MRNFRLSLPAVPANLNEMIAYAGFALVVMSAVGVHAFWPGWLIPVIGVFLGFTGIGDSKQFLLAGLSLMAVKWGLNFVPMIGPFARELSSELVRLVAPAMLIVSIRSIFDQMR